MVAAGDYHKDSIGKVTGPISGFAKLHMISCTACYFLGEIGSVAVRIPFSETIS
jgi:hypothetical protein